MIKASKRYIFIALTAVIIFLIGFYFNKSARGFQKVNNSCIDGYYLYPLDKGYGPGSILVIDRHWFFKDRIKVQRLQISRDKIAEVVVKPEILKESDANNIASCNFNRDDNLKFSFDSGFDSSDERIIEDIEIKNLLNNISRINYSVKSGKRVRLSDGGGSAFRDVLNFMPAYELEKILEELQSKNELFFVSEVISYDDANLVVEWSDSISADLQTKLMAAFDISGYFSWSSEDKLEIEFAKGTIVGFSGKVFEKNDVELIERILQERAIKGNLIRLYEDRDEDTFGSKQISNSYIFGEKEIPEREINNQIVKYVRNNLDPDDTDDNRGFGERKWYRDNDKDGYGDPNNFIMGLKCPNGYIGNDKDCYDNNALAFPGQTRFFSNHRGDGSFDYDCNQNSQKQYSVIGGCASGCRELRSGWQHGVPNCGQSAAYVVGCDNGNWYNRNCTVHSRITIQNCR